MKKLHLKTIFMLFCICGAIVSCSKITNLVSANFDYNNSDLTFTIPAQAAVGDIVIEGNEIYINADSLIKAQSSQLSINNIKSLTVKSCVLNITSSSAGQDFSALQSCKLSIYTGSNPTPTDIAELTNNPDVASTTLTIPVKSSVDLATLFKSNNIFKYKIAATTRRAVTLPTECKANITLTIKAGL